MFLPQSDAPAATRQRQTVAASGRSFVASSASDVQTCPRLWVARKYFSNASFAQCASGPGMSHAWSRGSREIRPPRRREPRAPLSLSLSLSLVLAHCRSVRAVSVIPASTGGRLPFRRSHQRHRARAGRASPLRRRSLAHGPLDPADPSPRDLAPCPGQRSARPRG
jgi:hypothetical protein